MVALVSTLAASVTSAAQPAKVASANLCADQLLLELADPEQIVALSVFARDRTLSYHAARAKRFPSARGTGEELIRLAPDLVLLGRYDNRYTRPLLDRRGIPYLVLETWNEVASTNAGVRQVAAALGQPARGEALVHEILREARSVEALRSRLGERRPTVLILQRGGYVIKDGLIAETIARAGLRNAASEAGLPANGFADIERIVAARPDYLLLSADDLADEDQGSALLSHPALARLVPEARRLVASNRLTLCAGPSTPAMLRQLRWEIESKVIAPRTGAVRAPASP